MIPPRPVSVITGASSGIGAALARRAACEGMDLVLCDRNEAGLGELAASLRGVHVVAARADVLLDQDLEHLAERAFSTFGRVDMLFCNAGVGGVDYGVPVWERTMQEWTWMIDTNLFGIVRTLRAFLPRMQASGLEGVVILTASANGLTSGPGSPYAAAKAAVVRLGEGLDFDLRKARSKIRCVVLCPGLTRTEIIKNSMGNRPEKYQEEPDLAERVRAAASARGNVYETRGGDPDVLAKIAFDGIASGRLYVLAHDESQTRSRIDDRYRAITRDVAPRESDAGRPAVPYASVVARSNASMLRDGGLGAESDETATATLASDGGRPPNRPQGDPR